MLMLDRNYTPVELHENDEIFRNGIFQWNITKIIQYIDQYKSNISTSRIDVTEHYSSKYAFANISQDHVNLVDINIPVIQAEINPNQYMIIDGHHRLVKAYYDGVKYMESYILKVNQHIPFFITVKSYKAFVKYWNSKVLTGGEQSYLQFNARKN
jgi:hypothetical protein